MSDFLQQVMDLNPKFGLGSRELTVTGYKAIQTSLVVLVSSHVGVRSKTFNQFYGNGAFEIFQEPISEATAAQLRAALFSTIEKFEPRVQLNYGDCLVVPVASISGYLVTLSYRVLSTGEEDVFSFKLT